MPVIGITCDEHHDDISLMLRKYYILAIEECGGVPIILPPVGKEALAGHLEIIDGLVLSGGVDVDPVYFKAEPLPACGRITPKRDDYEINLVKNFVLKKKPLLAICRGMQVLNIACGGYIYQDIYSEINTPLLKHSQDAPKWHPTHSVNFKKDSFLFSIMGKETISVNSFHHQAVSVLADGFKIAAESPDGIVEAIEHEQYPIFGVQWHPEWMFERNIIHRKLFSAIVSFSRNLIR